MIIRFPRRFFIKSLFGVCLICASTSSFSNELILGGKSAQEAFNNEGVVKLLSAVINRNVSEANRLIASGVDVDTVGEKGVTPLLWFELNQDADAMQLMLELGANPNKWVLQRAGETGLTSPVWMAARAGWKKILQTLLEHGGDPNSAVGTNTPLMIAISGSHLECAELLLQHGADINLTVAPVSALSAAMLHVQFGDAIWVLNHGYTHDLNMGRRILSIENPRPGQEAMKVQALELIDKLLAAQKKQ